MTEHEDDDHVDPLAEGAMVEGLFSDLGEAKRVEPRWIIKDLLPVGLTIIGAPPKEGKSILTMIMAATVADLKPKALPPDLSIAPESGRVICFSYEATAGELKVMMEDGIHVKVPNDGRILVADDPWLYRLDEDESQKNLIEILKRQRPKLVILDTFRDMHDLEEKDSGAMVRMLKPLREWACNYDASVLMVHHTVKVGEDVSEFGAKHLRGSGAIFGKADGVIMMTRRPDGTHLLKGIFKRAKSWEKTIRLAVYDVKGGGSEPLVERDVLVLKALKAKASIDRIAEQLHIGKQTVVAHCQKLQRNGYVVKQGQRYKALKKEVVR